MYMHNLSENVKELWNGWELRAMMLLSLFLQILLVIFGNRRKYMAGRWLGIFIWLAYLSADWVATVSLGILARSQGVQETKSTIPKFIPLFWAPALLVHLGGPDTITAYSMEDNELWLRHLLELVTQVSVAFYVLLRLWSNNALPFVTIPIFVVGIYKYGERIWVLRSASSQKFEDSAINEISSAGARFFLSNGLNGIVSEAKFLHEAHFLFRMFKVLTSNLLLPCSYLERSYEMIPKKNATEAFKLIEVELGFVYDVFYTKIKRVRFRRIILRSIGFLSTISALVAFSMTISKHDYSGIDIVISYILLVGAIILEIYSVMMLLFSDWTMLWFSMQNVAGAKCFYRATWPSRLQSLFNNGNRWSGSMAQHDLLIAIAEESSWNNFLVDLLDRGNIQRWEVVSTDLKELIFNQLLEKRSRYYSRPSDLKQILEERGDEVLRRKNCFNDFGWSVDLEFDHSLLVWHIATSICYLDEFHKNRECGGGGALDPSCIMSKSLSNYMLYLLLDCSYMLPKGMGKSRYRDTKYDVIFSASPLSKHDPTTKTGWDAFNAYVRAYSHSCGYPIEQQISANSGGLKLAGSLLAKDGWSSKEKWEMISEVWVEMLIYAAAQCEWKENVKALARGGELLTFVSFLKTHLGLTMEHRPDRYKEFFRYEGYPNPPPLAHSDQP